MKILVRLGHTLIQRSFAKTALLTVSCFKCEKEEEKERDCKKNDKVPELSRLPYVIIVTFSTNQKTIFLILYAGF
jgi:hypothetical protein